MESLRDRPSARTGSHPARSGCVGSLRGVPLSRKILVVGNSGSGKSTLAEQLMDQGLAHLDLDLLAWLDTDPPTRRPVPEVAEVLRSFIARERSWVVEGCYADLLALVARDATELIFLDLDVATCQAHAKARPWEPHKYASKEVQDANLQMLLGWIGSYPDRDGPLGRAAHVALFEGFDGDKRRITEPLPG